MKVIFPLNITNKIDHSGSIGFFLWLIFIFESDY